MALTPDLTTITLTGTYVDIQGTPISGSVTFTPQSIIKDTDQNQIIVNQTLTATLNANGEFSIVLPITDDTDITPQPFAYAVEEVFTGGRSFFITLPVDTPDPQDIADLAPAVSTAEAANYVTQAQYNTLLARYNAANAEYTQIGNTGSNLDNIELYADQAETANTETSKVALNQFVLMGM